MEFTPLYNWVLKQFSNIPLRLQTGIKHVCIVSLQLHL